MPGKRIAEFHALERSPIAKKLWFSIHLSSLVTVFTSFHTFKGSSLSHKLLGNFLATFADLCYLEQLSGNFCDFEQRLIFGANWLNFKQLMAIKKPYNTVKSCYTIYARKKISVLSALCLPAPQLDYLHYEVSGSQIRPCFSKMATKSKFQIVKRNKFPSRLLCLEWEWLFHNRRIHLWKPSWNTCKD